MPERAQGRVLHDVLCVVIAPREIARQGVRRVQMRQHDGFESLELARLQPVLGVCGTPSSEDSASGGVIPAGISAGRMGSPPSRETVVTHAQEEDRHERSEEHTSELQSHSDLVCRLLLEKKKKQKKNKRRTRRQTTKKHCAL